MAKEMIDPYHPEDAWAESNMLAELQDELEQLNRSLRAAQGMRRNCISIIEQAMEGREHFEKEEARILGEIGKLEQYMQERFPIKKWVEQTLPKSVEGQDG